MKRTDPRDTVYTSDAEDLRRRYLLERVKTGEEEKSSPVYSSGHGVNIDESNTINIVTADGISPDETLPPSSAEVYDAFVRTDESLNQLEVNLAVVKTDFDDFSEEISDEISKLNNRFSDFGNPKVLWSGGRFMTAAQTAALSEKVSEQTHGVVLVWSAYSDSAPADNSWYHVFVSKYHVIAHNGSGMTCGLMTNTTMGYLGYKYVYVYDDKITGHDQNGATGTASSITYANNHWVLRYVLGF